MIRCEKWHGAGNDFLVASERDGVPVGGWSEWAVRACDRHRGLGADGLLVLLEADGLHMGYWNADGSAAEMCGNGGRVLAAYAAERGWAAEGAVHFRSAWGEHDAQVTDQGAARYLVALTLPDVPAPEPVRVAAPWGPVEGLFVVAGVPHLLLRREQTPAPSLEAVPVEEWGRTLRRHPLPGGAGANVDFLEPVGVSGLRLRTFERGVEGETLACGTGAVAAAAAGVAWGLGTSPIRVTAWSGESLEVSFSLLSGALRTVKLVGPAVRVACMEAAFD